jgi:hypothetical protein
VSPPNLDQSRFPVHTWAEVQKLASDAAAVGKLPPVARQMLALAQIVARGKSARTDIGPRGTRRYTVGDGRNR